MSHINFIIPQALDELLNCYGEQYSVKDIISIKELQTYLTTAKTCFKDEGADFIIDNFDVFYSIVHHADKVQLDVAYSAYLLLHKASQDFGKSLNLIFEDKDNWSDEFKMKYVNVLKMLLYAYVNIIKLVEQKNDMKRRAQLNVKAKGRKKMSDEEDSFSVEQAAVLLALNHILQHDIHLFFDNDIIDDAFVTMISEICYQFLESPNIKSDKQARTEVWSLLGLLVKNYSHGMTFVVRLVQLIKLHEHLSSIVPEGVQYLVDVYHVKGLVRDLIREITEWQTDEAYADSQGSRYCAKVLSDMASLMPNLMVPEVMYLNNYLYHESYPLRNSVLNVMTEVILTALTKKDLSEEERESRDEILLILEEHINDNASFVRTRVFQHWARLQKENAVPIKMQANILMKAVLHLHDKAATTRKSAAHCVTTFLEHNLYGSTLQLGNMRRQLNVKLNDLAVVKAKIEGIHLDNLKEAEEEWSKREKDIKEVIEMKMQDPTQETYDKGIDVNQIPTLIRKCIMDGKYGEAFEMCRIASKSIDEFKKMREEVETDEEIELFMLLMRTIFTNIVGNANVAAANQAISKPPSEEDFNQLNNLERTVDYMKDTVTFLEHIDDAMTRMKDLLDSVSFGDFQEATDFFIAAYKFNVDNSLEGVLAVLKLMQRGEQDRREIVLNALKTIYLMTDSKSMAEHTSIIVNRLIDLLIIVPYDSYPDLTLMVSEWVQKGMIDNSVIDMLWNYFIKKTEISDEKSRAALTLLTMAAQGRRTIVTRNIKLISVIAFGERGLNDILLATQACRMLSIAGREKQDITDKNPPFRINSSDEIWKNLCDLFITFFDKPVKFVNGFITESIDLIFRLCSTPIKICDALANSVLNKIGYDTKEAKFYIIIRYCTFVGIIALKLLNYLDENVYKELKRRNYIREKIKNKDQGKKTTEQKRPTTGAIRRANVSNSFLHNTTITDDNLNESTLEGAQAEDIDAEFIFRILESRTVTENTDLNRMAKVIVKICQHPEIYEDVDVQCAAITALLRLALVSSVFCQNHIQLIFTILEKTAYEDVKITILIHCSDLLEKCPNVIEPYTNRLHNKLCDPSIIVRKATFFMLGNLILRDMVRPGGHISEMAKCIVDSELELRDMAKSFFQQHARKSNNLFNILPDIFNHLVEETNQENFEKIMKFLFNLVDRDKHMQNLVDRFCAKFRITDNENVAKNITFCLSLIHYNEKGLKRLVDNFPAYKNYILVDDIYLTFKQIMNNCSKGVVKNEIKVLVKDLEDKIAKMFKTTEGDEMPKEPPKLSTKRSTARKVNRKKSRKVASESEESEASEEEFKSNKKSLKGRNTRRARSPISSDSD